MNKQTLFGLLFLTVSSPVIAEEYISSEYYEEIIAQSEIDSSFTELNIIESNPIVEPIIEEKNEFFEEEVVSETKIEISNIIEKISVIELSPYEEVLQKAKNEDKIIMLAIRATDCNYCDKMEKETLSDEAVKEALDANFITIHYNQDLEPLPLGLQEGMTPTFVFVNTNEDILNMYPGMRNPDEFKEVLEQILAL